ncbi:MAG: hypothetical protein H7338_15685 [Candidatus Sericytochromatia bacterium]|nr:hypothetical protein [Candidatus Sericytochromatia bacterium]
MVLRDRLIQLSEGSHSVRIYSGRGDDYYVARIVRVGHDYLEFEAYRDGEKWGEVLMLLADVRRVEVFNVDSARNDLDRLYKSSSDEKGDSRKD